MCVKSHCRPNVKDLVILDISRLSTKTNEYLDLDDIIIIYDLDLNVYPKPTPNQGLIIKLRPIKGVAPILKKNLP